MRMRIEQIFKYHIGVEKDKLHDAARFDEDLGMDSLDCIEIAMDIEDDLGIAIYENELEPLKTMKDLLILLEKKCTPRLELGNGEPKNSGIPDKTSDPI